MYYIHWIDHYFKKWCAMPLNDSEERVLELVFLSNPEAHINQDKEKDIYPELLHQIAEIETKSKAF